MNMEMKLSPRRHFLFISFSSHFYFLCGNRLSLSFFCLPGQEVLMNEEREEGTQEFMECPDGLRCFRARQLLEYRSGAVMYLPRM